MGYTSNIDEIIAALQMEPTKLRRRVGEVVKSIVYMFDDRVHRHTPVWSGRAVRNMIWSKNTPNGSDIDPIRDGEEGEGRRAANSAAARNSLETLDFKDPFGIYWLSNCAFHITELEAGMLSKRVPPGGMFGTTYAEVIARLGK